jgi:hypothetical protein
VPSLLPIFSGVRGREILRSSSTPPEELDNTALQ